jgi:gamma-glutamyltranspeptidase/glutathione hydrolase
MISLPVSTTIMQILHILDNFDMTKLGYNSVDSIHVLTEAIKLAFTGRETYLGFGEEDPPFKGIISKDYAKMLADQITMEKALTNPDIGNPRLYQEGETTHACAVDKERNIAGIHSSLGDAFGCKVTIKGTGIILNDKMKGYDPRPGYPDSVKPRIIKPPPSGSTILLKDDKPFMVIGSPGGYKQVCAVSRSIHCYFDYGMPIRQAIDAPRVFVQTGAVFIDSRMPKDVCQALIEKGHDVNIVDREFGFARPNAIVIDPETGLLHGGIDGNPPQGADQITLGS